MENDPIRPVPEFTPLESLEAKEPRSLLRDDTRAKLADLSDKVDPAQKFEEMTRNIAAVQERIPMLKGMSPEIAQRITVLFGLILFIHSLEKRQQDAIAHRDEAEAAKLEAETVKIKAETRKIESASPGTPLTESKIKAVERQLFVERSKAPQIQTLLHDAVGKSLQEEGVSEREAGALTKGMLVYVDDEGNLIIDIPDDLRLRIQSLQSEGKKTPFREFGLADLQRITSPMGKTVHRATLKAENIGDKNRFAKMMSALGLAGEFPTDKNL